MGRDLRSPADGNRLMLNECASAPATAADAHRAIVAVWKMEQPRLITGLARMLRDIPLAEELTQEALVTALENWPKSGVPQRPGAWLMVTARRLAIDYLRRDRIRASKLQFIAMELEEAQREIPEFDWLDDDIGDELLRLIFTACHPILSREARTALTLRMVGGLTTEEIARAFLVPVSTIAQRIVRAKRTLSHSGLTYDTPRGDRLRDRMISVLEVIYLIFNEGYSATAGDEWMRIQLCDEARRLGRILTAVMPDEPEAHGLLSLMELNSSRAAARTDSSGTALLLDHQDRRRWDMIQVRRGLVSLVKALELGGGGGFYTLQATIAACHARAATPADTPWERIAILYGRLERSWPSPVIELNRAVAVAMSEGAEAGLTIVDRLAEDPSLRDYHLLPSVRGDLLERLGRLPEARAAFATAATMTANARERELLLKRATSL